MFVCILCIVFYPLPFGVINDDDDDDDDGSSAHDYLSLGVAQARTYAKAIINYVCLYARRVVGTVRRVGLVSAMVRDRLSTGALLLYKKPLANF